MYSIFGFELYQQASALPISARRIGSGGLMNFMLPCTTFSIPKPFIYLFVCRIANIIMYECRYLHHVAFLRRPA